MAITLQPTGTPCASCLDYCFFDDESNLPDWSIKVTVKLDGNEVVNLQPKLQGGAICFSVTDIVHECLSTPCPMNLTPERVEPAFANLTICLENSFGTTFETDPEFVVNALEDPLKGFPMASHTGIPRKFMTNIEKTYYCPDGKIPYLYAYLEPGDYNFDDGFFGYQWNVAEPGIYSIPVRTDLANGQPFSVLIQQGLAFDEVTSVYEFEPFNGEDGCCCESFKFLGTKGAFEHLATNCLIDGMLEVERKNYCEYIPCNQDPSMGGLRSFFNRAYDTYRAVVMMPEGSWEYRQWLKEFLYSREVYYFDCNLDSYVRIILTDTSYLIYDRTNRKIGVEFTFRYSNEYAIL